MPDMILTFHPSRPSFRPWEGKLFIGYWEEKPDPYFPKTSLELPNPRDFIDPSWDPVERAMVVAHLKAGETFASWRGWSGCRICGCMNGSRCLTDGTYVWPQGFAHYIEAHGVRPPQQFIDHVRGLRGC